MMRRLGSLSVCLGLMACGAIAGSPDGGGDSSADDGAGDALSVDAGLDGATGADAASDSAPADGGIASLQGLVLWLDAEKGITKDSSGLVSSWQDQSGHSNDATQASATRQPTFGASVIGGLPALHFAQGTTTGTQLMIQDSSSMEWGTGDFLVEVVARFDNAPAGGTDTGLGGFFLKQGALNGILFVGNRLVNGNLPASTGAMARLDMDVPGNGNQVDVGAAYNDGTARNYAFRRAGTTLDLRVNGASVASMTQVGTIDVSGSGVNATIGCDGWCAKARLDGDIAEIIGIQGPTSAPDVTAIEAHLQSKYGL